MLDREEYVEQAYFFRVLQDRIQENTSTQDLLGSIREEVLATTKLPMAIDYLLTELKHSGVFGPAFKGLQHYFTPFQAFVISEAENERGRFDFRVALSILQREAEYRALLVLEPSPSAAEPSASAGSAQPGRPGVFLFQFESICRNRLGYDAGLSAIAADPAFDAPWRQWIMTLPRRIGMVDIADLIYVRSAHYLQQQARLGKPADDSSPPLFGEREGRIALANRRKDPLLFFAALQRQLGYPAVPRPKPIDPTETLVPQLLRRMERLEQRLKLVEEEQRGGINLERFFKPPSSGESIE